jgi:hypothetical protein
VSANLYRERIKILNLLGATRCLPFAVLEVVVKKGGKPGGS